MTTPRYIEELMCLPKETLIVRTLTTNDKEGTDTTRAIIEGTPAGFRALANILLKMADTVDSAETKTGWGLVLHPNDIPALKALQVESLSLDCLPPNTAVTS